MNAGDLFQRMQSAASDDERHWLVTQSLLSTLPVEVAATVYAAAIPHWFTSDVLAALQPDLRAHIGDFYTAIQALPFVEPFQGRGHNIHELTRRVILQHLWQNDRDAFVRLSQHATDYFSSIANDERYIAIERVYHLVVVDTERGTDEVWGIGADWYNRFDYAAVDGLARAVREHADAGRVKGRVRGWSAYFGGLIAERGYNYSRASALYAEVIAEHYKDQALEANCIQSLGDVHVGLSELPEARARYAEALPIYRAIGDRLGEANCIQSLGELATSEKHYDTAFALLEDAAQRYRMLGLVADEANAINSIANSYDAMKAFDKAIDAYTRAIALFPKQAMWFRNRAHQYLKLRDAGKAERDIEIAAGLQPNHPYLFLRYGDLSIARGMYDAAIGYFEQALLQIPRLNGAWFGIGEAHLRAGRPAEALHAYRQGLTLTDSLAELEEPLDTLRDLKAEHPGLAGINDALRLLDEWTDNSAPTQP
ncbi:MAG: tetratricopeptide repeat protein [Chloroflexi bacterium]|nr:tetratricopeptide repeat protein [Chloroflexota bacterium]